MFSGKTTDDLLWALALFFLTKELGRRRKQGQGGPRPMPTARGVILEAGHYWVYLDTRTERDKYFGWLKRNMSMVVHVKLLGRPLIESCIVVFEVLHDRAIKWDPAGIPGIPTPAPKGAATTIEDIEGKGASSIDPDTFSEFLASLVQAGPQVMAEYDRYIQERLREFFRGDANAP